MKYQAYNLVIESSLSLRPLHEAAPDAVADVVFRKGSVSSDGIADPRKSHAFAQVGGDRVWLDVKDVARYLIEGGKTVTIEPYPGVDDDTLRLYLLGSGLGAILHQRGNLVLHANAIRVGDGAVLFAGVSGAGKSTTAAVFHQKGYQVIADDVVAIAIRPSG